MFLCETCVQFARFLLTTNARKDDPFLSGLNRMLNEEKSIYQKQNESIFNKQLATQLRTLIKDYKQLFDQIHCDSGKKILPDIYKLIRAVNEVPMIKEQIDAIREYQQFLLTSNEHDIYNK
jgi:ribosomal protein S20